MNDTSIAFERVDLLYSLQYFSFFESPFSLSESGIFVLHILKVSVCDSRKDPSNIFFWGKMRSKTVIGLVCKKLFLTSNLMLSWETVQWGRKQTNSKTGFKFCVYFEGLVGQLAGSFNEVGRIFGFLESIPAVSVKHLSVLIWCFVGNLNKSL